MPNFILTDVDPASVEYAVKNIEEYLTEISAMNSYFASSTMGELDPYWEGAAKETFEAKFISFSERFDKLYIALKDLNDQLKEAGTMYASAEDNVSKVIIKLVK